MGEPKRFRPVPPAGRPPHELRGIHARAADRGRQDRPASGGNGEQPMGGQKLPAPERVPREPFRERGPDASELGRTTRKRHDRAAQAPMDRVEVHDVEPPENGPVQQDRTQSVDRTGSAHESNHASCGVPAVDPDVVGADRLDVVRCRHDDRGDGGGPVRAREGAVVHGHDPGVRLTERAP